MRKIAGTKRDRIKAGWIKQHNEKLHDLYYRAIKWCIRSAGQVTLMGGERNGQEVFVEEVWREEITWKAHM